MRILVTGARGKVGAAIVDALLAAGHDVTGADLLAPAYEGYAVAHYVQVDLGNAGDAYFAVRGHDAVIHAAAIPEPTRNPPDAVFRNNLMATFNVVEACVRLGVGRLVSLSSETVAGMGFAERPFTAPYAPIDEDLPSLPQDPYALAKHFGEQLLDAAARRSDLRSISLRPSWVQWEGNYARSLGPWLRDPGPSESFWSYVDAYDLADAARLAAESELDGHHAMYVVAADNGAGRPLAELVARHYGDSVELRALPRPDAGGISFDRASRLLGYAPRRSWRDYLAPDGTLLGEVAERLARGDTGVQRGRAALG
jgi:nucleoside-diphosphate-sugar epimerase